MTTICLKARSSVKREAWSDIFTTFNTDAQSCLFMKQLTSTCISTILYLRKILSDEFFEAKTFEGMTLKILKSKAGDNYVFKIQQWLEGAFDAIEKKYLKRLMLDIQDADSNTILEVYTMNFTYNTKKDSNALFLTTSSKDGGFSVSTTKLNTIKLLQMCYAVTQTYRSLPSKVTLGMRLSYYENTPDDYEPSGYMAWEHADPEFSKQARSIEIGTTRTEHHFFKLLNKSCLSDTFFKGMEEQLEKNTPTVVLEGDDSNKKENISQIRKTKVKRELNSQKTDKDLRALESVSVKLKPEPVFVVTEKPVPITTKNHVGRTKVVKELIKLKVRCSCLFPKKSSSMFSCSSCKFLVHPECFGILEFDSSKKIRFYCHLCHQKENDFKCHDKILMSLKNPSHQQKLSVLRRVLRYCTKPYVKTLTLNSMKTFVGVGSQDVINVVLNKLIEIGVAIPQKKRKSYLIDKNELTNKLAKYFYKLQNSDPIKQEVLSCSLGSCDSLQRKDETEKSLHNKTSRKLPPALQEMSAYSAETVSQHSYDIFC